MKTKCFYLVLILGTIVLFFAQPLVAQQIISGTILDNGTGQPIEGADVFYYDEKGHFLKGSGTDGRGMFEFGTTIEPGKDIKIMINKHGEYTYTPPLKTVGKEGTNFGNIFLTKGPLGALKVNGYVKRRWSNKGIPNTIVSVNDQDNNRIPTLTNPDGFYEFLTRIQPGERIEFHVYKAGYKTKEKTYILKTKGNQIDFKLKRIIF